MKQCDRRRMTEVETPHRKDFTWSIVGHVDDFPKAWKLGDFSKSFEM